VSVTRKPTRAELHCLICNKPEVADDHIRERSVAPELRDDPMNQAAICPTCHQLKTDKRIRTRVKDGVYQWRDAWSSLWLSIPVVVSKRHGMLIREADGLPGDGKLPTNSAAAEDYTKAPGAIGAISSVAALSGEAEEAEGRTKASLSAPGSKGSASLLPASPGLTPLGEDWSALSDDDLQAKYDAAEQMQGMAYLLKCKAVHTYRENHVQMWGESWTEQAIERFNVSRRTLEVYANLWRICVSRDAYFEQVSPLTDSRSLLRYIGLKKPEDGAVAMEAAVAHYAEYAEPPTVMALAHKLGEDGDRPEPMLTCPECGHSAARSEFR